MILAGDVGGTKTLLGLFKQVNGRLRAVREASFPSQSAPSFTAIVDEFLAQGREKVHRVAVGVAGPVVDGDSQVINLRWPVNARRLATHLSLDRAWVLNDLEATAWGISELPSRKFANLTPGLRVRAGSTAALIAAGTGLGMALLFHDGKRYRPRASEGGHQQFGPRDDLEIDLMRFLRLRYGRVSNERVVSGPGFSSIYQFLIETGRVKESARMAKRLAQPDIDPNAVIADAGLARDDPAAARTVDLFVSVYGSAAGDLALVSRATGGVYLGGGIAPRILKRLQSGEFVRSFRAKGRLAPLLEKIPVRVILEPRTALLGAAAYAASRVTPRPKSSTKAR
jgi:glucokinase